MGTRRYAVEGIYASESESKLSVSTGAGFKTAASWKCGQTGGI